MGVAARSNQEVELPAVVPAFDSAAFERSTRPLLDLVRALTGLETSFVSRIDWDRQRQTVVLASNTADLQVVEGSVVEWSDSMCRWAFLTGIDHTADVQTDYPGSVGSEMLGMRSFLAVPILADEQPLGTVCAASRHEVQVSEETMDHLRLIAESVAVQLVNHVAHERDRRRAEDAEILAMTDSLTGLANHRAFTVRLEEELARSGRHGTPIAVLAIDVDSFKAINDTYGHAGGDEMLCVLGEVLRTAARVEDVPARLGGDEFAVLLPETDEAGARTMAARIAEGFRHATTSLEKPATLSIGVSSSTSIPRRELMVAADEDLYKRRGMHLQLRSTARTD